MRFIFAIVSSIAWRKLPASRFQTINEVINKRSDLHDSAPTAKTPSIAVLPFAIMSADKVNEYFMTYWPERF